LGATISHFIAWSYRCQILIRAKARALLFVWANQQRRETMAESIQAYFFGTSFGEQVDGKNAGLYGFAVPDLGVVFRSRHSGSIYECQYAGLLALLKFLESNRKELNEYRFEVLSDSPLIVYQISHRKIITAELTPYYNAAIDYKCRIDYRISWVPREENIAITGMNEIPPFRPDLELKLDIDIPDGNQARQNSI
jgi:hypothetical protein